MFSGYKSSRIVSPTFMKAQIEQYRAFGDYVWNRPWSGFYCLIALDPRFYCVFIPVCYWIHYYHHERITTRKAGDAMLCKRWGPTVEDVRKNLTPSEQLIVRNFRLWEQANGLMVAHHIRFRPQGCDLPTFEDVHGKGAHLAGH
jgi:hypothetical protein